MLQRNADRPVFWRGFWLPGIDLLGHYVYYPAFGLIFMSTDVLFMGLFASDAEKREKRQQQLNKLLFKPDPEKVRAALAAGAQPDAVKNKDGQSPLYFHASNGHSACLSALLAHGCDIENGNDDTWTPLLIAARAAKHDCVVLLADAGANLNAQPKNGGYGPMHWAAYWGRGNTIEFLLAKGADRNLTDNHMDTAADVADKEKYPRLGDLIRGKTTENVAPAQTKYGWVLTAPHEIALVREKNAIGYRLTEMFNFKTGLYTQIAANVATGAESQSMRSFEEFPDTTLIREAMEELTKKGGAVDEAMTARLANKPSLSPKQLGAKG